MRKTSAIGLVALSALLTATGAVAQPADQTTYTFVAEWTIPRAQWATFATDFEKNSRPVLEKLSAGGTLVGWGAFETVVHTLDGPTHGIWWSATSATGIEQARTELLKSSAASTAITGATAHHDYYLRSLLGNGKAGSGTGGFLTVASYLVKPGQGTPWRQLWEKNTKPMFDELVAKGLLLGYSVDVEDLHTGNPGLRFVASVSPNIEAEDKGTAVFEAAAAKRSADEQKALADASAAVLEPGAHRDQFARVIRYWFK